MTAKPRTRYQTDPRYRARMLRSNARWESRNRSARNAWKRRYRHTMTIRQKRLARAARRRWYVRNRKIILANARAAYAARSRGVNPKPV